MRIGIDATPIFLPLGGIGYYLVNNLKHLARVDPDNEYILYNTGPSAGKFETPFQHAGNFQIVNAWHPVLCWRVKRNRIDVFHGPNYRLPARGLRGSIVSIYDLSVARLPYLFRKAMGRKRDFAKSKRMAETADHVITISYHSASDIADLYEVPKEKIAVVYCGIGDEFFPEKDETLIRTIRKRYNLENREYLLYVGGSDPRKNAVTLLRAYSALSELHQQTALVLVGSMKRRSEPIFKIIRDNHLDRAVIMVGNISQEALRVLYSQAAVFVFPSLYEGFGMPVLEAMACGVPVITSNSSSIPEVAGDAAVLIDPTDAKALAASIRCVMNDREARTSMKLRGFARTKLFSWETAARQTLAVYQDVYKQGQGVGC